MSAPFKIKGWRGNQSSPIRQNPKVSIQTSLANIQTRISNTLKGIGTNIRRHVKPQSSSSGFGLTSLEKAQAKKHGMSQYQWKTDRNKSGTRANRYARDNKLGKYAEKSITTPDEKNVIDIQGSTAETYTGGFGPDWTDIIEGGGPSQGESTINTPTEVDYGTGMTTKDWKQESSTGWSLHELTQERKNFDPGSPEYDKIQKAINLGYETGGPVEESDPVVEEKKEEEAIPEGYAQYGYYPDTQFNRDKGIAGDPIIQKLTPGDKKMPYTTVKTGGPKKGKWYKMSSGKVMMFDGNNYVAG